MSTICANGLTHHSRVRVQQRRIPERVVEWAIEFGDMRRANGADIYCFDKKGRGRLRRHLGDALYGRLEKLLDVYVVIADGRVVTVGHRLKRIPL